MSQPKPNVARKVAGVLTTVVIGIAFFFAIIGVFGLWVAIGGLALAILTAGIIIPTPSIGLAMFLTVVEGLWLKTRNPVYLQIYRFWLGIFAMAFGVGVVTAIALSFEVGLAFARFDQMAGPRGRRRGG